MLFLFGNAMMLLLAMQYKLWQYSFEYDFIAAMFGTLFYEAYLVGALLTLGGLHLTMIWASKFLFD